MTDPKKKDKPKPKKQSKNEIEQIIEEAPPKRDENTINSELISKLVLAKLLSYVSTEIDRRKIGKLIESHCYSFMKNMMDQGLASLYLTYDKDDYVKTEPQKQKMFYNNKKEEDNTWIEIHEPCRIRKERLAGTLINYIKPLCNNDLITETEREQFNSPLAIKKPKQSSNQVDTVDLKQSDIQQDPFMLEDVNVNKTINSSTSNTQRIRTKIRIKDKSLLSMSNNRPRTDLDTSDNPTPREAFVFNIPNKDIPNIKQQDYPEREEDNQLRKDLLTMSKREASLSEIIVPKKPIKEYSSITNKNKKPFNGQKYTFDSNGNIMHYKSINPEVLSNEFWWNKPEIKDLATVNNSLIPNKYVPYKNILQLSLFQGQIKTPKKPEIVEYNNEENNAFIKNNNVYVRKPPGPVFVPSGSCFKLIHPETGVVVKENKLIKEGASDFAAKYNKTSIEQYSKMISQSDIYNSLKVKRGLSAMMGSIQGNASYNENDSQPPYLGYKDNIKSSNNPLIQAADHNPSLINSYPTIPPQLITTQINPFISNTNTNTNTLQMSVVQSRDNSHINERIRILFDLPYPNQQDKCEIINNSILSKSQPHKTKPDLKQSLSTKLFQGKYNSKILLKKPKMDNKGNSFVFVNSFNQNIMTNKAKWGGFNFEKFRNDSLDLQRNELNKSVGITKPPKRRKYYHSNEHL